MAKTKKAEEPTFGGLGLDSIISLGGTLPGEKLIIKVLDVVLEAMRGQTAVQRATIWSFVVRDMRRWRKFWNLDRDDDLLREQTEAAAGILARIRQAEAEGSDAAGVELDVEFLKKVASLLEGDVLPGGGILSDD